VTTPYVKILLQAAAFLQNQHNTANFLELIHLPCTLFRFSALCAMVLYKYSPFYVGRAEKCQSLLYL